MQKVQGFGTSVVHAYLTDELLKPVGEYYLSRDQIVPLLFTENETNHERLFGTANTSFYVKDGIDNYVVQGQEEAANASDTGTKVSPHYQLTIGAEETRVIQLRLSSNSPTGVENLFGDGFTQLLELRRQEADEFYDSITPDKVKANPERANVMRQALAGMLWSKQYFYYDLDQWLR